MHFSGKKKEQEEERAGALLFSAVHNNVLACVIKFHFRRRQFGFLQARNDKLPVELPKTHDKGKPNASGVCIDLQSYIYRGYSALHMFF